MIKHEKVCFIFIPFVFDIFGFLAAKTFDLLHRVQRLMNNNVVFPRSMNVIFKRIDLAIQIRIVMQFVTLISLQYHLQHKYHHLTKYYSSLAIYSNMLQYKIVNLYSLQFCA